MRTPLADTRTIPLAMAAAMYEANAADTDFMAAWLSRNFTYEEALPRRDYRAAAETVMDSEFAAYHAARS
ncbi:hypothetical protein ABT024_05155 [Streptomyces sp. NPDC002812]|uniref:hypothetical protein n=1 Tax=Streptomyces sp. NPDC002812 TaxID=3154434 RepID=UPI00331CB586